MGQTNANNLPEYLRKGKDGAFILDFRTTLEDGSKKRVIKSLGKIPKALAIQIRDKAMVDRAEGRFLKPKAQFRQAAEGFLEYSRGRKRSYKDDQRLVAVLVAYFGDRLLESLSPNAVEAFLNHIQGQKQRQDGDESQNRKILAPGSLNRYIACLKTIVNRALANHLIDRNPIQGVKLYKENVRDRVLRPEEYQRLLEACSGHLVPIVTLAYRTGMRRGEILGLRWDQLSLAEKVILLKSEDTKTSEAREVPLDDGLVETLRRVPRFLGCPYVFAVKGKAIGTVKTAFLSACRRAGIEDFRFHDLRHCAVTNLRKAGVPQNVIMSISGHKTDAMLRRYDKVDREDRQAALESVRRFYEGRPDSLEQMA
ncbi:MAG TPA: site-specific integrase [bacterium]|jgi:integrase|nr:site-specific integrase [bacterium]